MDKSSRAFLPELMLLIGMAVLLFMNIGALDIDPYSELFHIQSAKESVLHGRFWTPLLHGHDYIVRGPLWTWIVMGFFKVLGISLWAARLPAVILSLGALGLIYMLTLELTKSRFSAFFAAAVFGTTWGFFHLGSLSTADILVTDIFLGFLWAFLMWKNFAARRNVVPMEMNLFSLLMGCLLGVLILTKGLFMALGLVGIAGLFLILTDSTLVLTRLNLSLFTLPVFLIPLPWLIWASVHSGKSAFMVEYLFVFPIQKVMGSGLWQNLQGDHFFYLKRLPLDLLPYLLFVPVALLDQEAYGGRNTQHSQSWMIWLLCWFGLGFLLFSFSRFQEPSMMLPFYAPLAIMVGCYLGQVMESGGAKLPNNYQRMLMVYILLMMAVAVCMTVIIFQVIPSNYVAGFWHLPGLPLLETIQLKDKIFPLPEAFPLWKFWLIPGPFVLLLGGFTMFVLQSGRKMTLTPLAMISTFVIFLLFIKGVYMPIMQRPVPQRFAAQINHQMKPGDQLVLYSMHPDVKRVLFYIDAAKLPVTHFIRNRDQIGERLENGTGVVYGVIRERSYFTDLGYDYRSLLRVNQFNWRWDMTRLSELNKLVMARLPNFDHMRSEMIFFQSLPAETLRTLKEEELRAAQEAEAENGSSGSRRRRRRRG